MGLGFVAKQPHNILWLNNHITNDAAEMSQTPVNNCVTHKNGTGRRSRALCPTGHAAVMSISNGI